MKSSTTLLIAVVAVAGVLTLADRAEAGGFRLRIGGLSISSGGYDGTTVVIGSGHDRYVRSRHHVRRHDYRHHQPSRRHSWRRRRFYSVTPVRPQHYYRAVPQPYYRQRCR